MSRRENGFGTGSRGPKWLRRGIGVDYDHDVIAISLQSAEAAETNRLFELLDRFPRLESLAIPQAMLSERDLSRISGLAHLQNLDLSYSNLTDDGMERLSRLTNLRTLDITASKVTDREIGLLSRCRRLEDLELTLTDVTRDGIGHLADIPTLRHVSLEHIATEEVLAGLGKVSHLESVEIAFPDLIAYPGLQPEGPRDPARLGECLRRLPHLKVLSLILQKGDSAGALAEIGRLQGLERLSLFGGDIDDENVQNLRTLRRLKTLEFVDCPKLTAKGISSLQLAMPWVEITP